MKRLQWTCTLTCILYSEWLVVVVRERERESTNIMNMYMYVHVRYESVTGGSGICLKTIHLSHTHTPVYTYINIHTMIQLMPSIKLCLLIYLLCCSLQMGKYPRLREEAERIMSTFLREQEERCKSHVSREREKRERERERENVFTELTSAGEADD